MHQTVQIGADRSKGNGEVVRIGSPSGGRVSPLRATLRKSIERFTDISVLAHEALQLVLAMFVLNVSVEARAAQLSGGEVVLPVSTLWGQEKLLYVNTKIPPCGQVPADTGGKPLVGVMVGCPAVAVGQLINYWFENGQANGWLDTMLQGVEVYPRPWSFGGIGQAACTHPGFLTEDRYESAAWDQVKRFLWHVGIGLDTNYDQSISGLKVYHTEVLKELICPPQICGTLESPDKIASLLEDRFRFKVINGPSRRLARLDDASDVIVAAIDERRPVLVMLSEGLGGAAHMALIDGYRTSFSGGLSRYDFRVNFGWGAGYSERWVPGGGPFATGDLTWKQFWVIDVAPVTVPDLESVIAAGTPVSPPIEVRTPHVPGLAQSVAINGPDGKPLSIKVGMTLKEAINELKPEYQTYVLGGDSGWGLQIHDNASYEEVLLSLWSDESQDYTINYAAKVRVISIHSPKYKTKQGVHVGMLLTDAEKKLGKIKSIYTSEPAFEEYAEFTIMPPGIGFGVSGGILEEGKRETQRYSPDARITKMTVTD